MTGLRLLTRCALWVSAALLLVCVALPLSGCKELMEVSKEGQRLDDQLHAAMSRGDWDGIYANADPQYREGATAEKSRAYLSAVVRKLGNPTASKQTSWTLNTNTSGTFLRSECETTFATQSTGTETIVWRKSDGVYRLFSYNINSTDLITR